MRKLIRDTVTEKVDHTTGEICETTREQIIQIPNEPPFVKLYIEDLRCLHRLPPKSSALLYELVKRVDYEGMVGLTTMIKKTIAETLSTSVASIDNQLSKLIMTNIILRIGRGTYMLNPSLFAKGQWKDVRKLRDKFFEFKVTYSPDGDRSIEAGVKNAM
mgnify:CR=1 FL=1